MNKYNAVCLSLVFLLYVSPLVLGSPYPGWQSLPVPSVNPRGSSVISCGRLISWYALGACVMTDNGDTCLYRMNDAPVSIAVNDEGTCDGTQSKVGYCTSQTAQRQNVNALEHSTSCSNPRLCRDNFFVEGKTEARFTINSIKSKLPVYALRAGLEVEIDIAYGFASTRTAPRFVNGDNGAKVKVELAPNGDFGGANAGEKELIASVVCANSACDSGMELVDYLQFPSNTGVTSLVNCQTLRLSFTDADEFNLEYDTEYSIRVTVFNARNFETSGEWFYNPTLDVGSEIGISAVRIIETVGSQPETRCLKYTGPLKPLNEDTSDTDIAIRQYLENDNQNSRYGGPEDGCHVCPGLYSGGVYCTQQNLPAGEPFMKVQFDYDHVAAGQKITGGYFILYGAEIGNSITATLKMDLDNDGEYETPLFEYVRPIEATPSYQGRYFFCGNCFYNTYLLTQNIDLIPPTPTNAALFFPSTGLMCAAGYRFVFTTSDIQGPQFGNAGVCDTAVHQVTIYPSDGVTGASTGDLDDYYVPFTATDNCDLYRDEDGYGPDIALVSKQIDTVTIWDYRYVEEDYLEQVITVKDYSGNTATCKSKLKILLGMPFVLYPQPSSTVPVNDIIVQWSNYAPMVDASARVKIVITPNSGCSSTNPLTLTSNFPYAKFIFYYRDSIALIDTSSGCDYTLTVTLTDPTSREVTFVVENVKFAA